MIWNYQPEISFRLGCKDSITFFSFDFHAFLSYCKIHRLLYMAFIVNYHTIFKIVTLVSYPFQRNILKVSVSSEIKIIIEWYINTYKFVLLGPVQTGDFFLLRSRCVICLSLSSQLNTTGTDIRCSENATSKSRSSAPGLSLYLVNDRFVRKILNSYLHSRCTVKRFVSNLRTFIISLIRASEEKWKKIHSNYCIKDSKTLFFQLCSQIYYLWEKRDKYSVYMNNNINSSI